MIFGGLEAALNLLFPPKCPFCGEILPRPGLCGRCGADFPGDYWWQGEFLCAAPLRYEGAVRECLLRFKFHGDPSLAEPLGTLMAQCALRRYGQDFDAVTWVPVSPRRRRKRGYDQAELLAKALCRTWGGMRPRRLLRKIRENAVQSGLKDPAQRLRNVRDVYVPAFRLENFPRRVLLVDDICTTGATLGECRRVLLANGVEEAACIAAALAGE